MCLGIFHALFHLFYGKVVCFRSEAKCLSAYIHCVSSIVHGHLERVQSARRDKKLWFLISHIDTKAHSIPYIEYGRLQMFIVGELVQVFSHP